MNSIGPQRFTAMCSDNTGNTKKAWRIIADNVRVEGLLVSVRIHQRKDSRGDRVGGGMDRGRRDCPAGYCFGLWGGWNI